MNITSERSARFSFKKKGVPIGAMLKFIEDTSITVPVISDEPPIVVFENKKWKLSPLAGELKKRNGTSNQSGAHRGALYFTYNGTRLIDLDDISD